MKLGKITDYKYEGNKLTLDYEKGKANIYFITDEIVRFEIPYATDSYESIAVEGDKSLPCEFKVEKTADELSISGKKVNIKVMKDFAIEVTDKKGKGLMTDYTGDRTIRETISVKSMQQLEAEGHEAFGSIHGEYKVQNLKAIDKDDLFYGLGDKTGYLNKREYYFENWNSDIPLAHTEAVPALYKSIPFFICKKKDGVYGLFYDNTYHGYFDFGQENSSYFVYGADDGNLNYYYIHGESMAEIIKGYTYLTGRTPMPQLWTLGYHQCRWGYESAKDIRDVAYTMRENRIPCESVQYDIDYMDNFKVFTWDENFYEKKGKLMEELSKVGFKPVVIIDPGTKKEEGYFMYDEGVENDYFAKAADGSLYINKVWPGDSAFPDFGREDVRKWWAKSHKNLTDMGVMGVWNDMNEPASFEGPLPGDVVFHIGDRTTDHREVHNVYAHFMDMATFSGMKELTGKRPLVITRACYAGTQKYAAVWTGDNQSLWAHLQMLIPQLCSLGMSGFALLGTDIGGFGGTCNSELLCRWIQAAVFSPFFRNHAAKGTRNQEPWKFNKETTNIYRKYVELRYKFLPYIYDLFHECQETGLPIMRPLVLHYEDDENTYNLNDEFLVGENILVSPVVMQGATKKMVYLPKGTWYDYWTGEKLQGETYFIKDAPLGVCPIYIKEGSIIPTYESVQYVGEKPYDKLILLTTPGAGRYVHYQDNGEDYKYENGEYNLYEFTKSENGELSTNMLHEGYAKYNSIEVSELK
ncbi:glycoside hydrolase family 31 protein [Butyrivibrio sp. XPD2002]|uniref:glycoside hydrolase family 31 protein n=1 Tax=Butyrivibrio sp. XPD2002 TaxID=1280665 RepID=UPI00040C3FC8|nr:glycoside hydrolase family 31 protein [Butyrivibrio sp. XPD2002]